MNQELDEEFAEFMRDRWPAMARLAYGLTGNPWTAEDVAQASFTKAYAAPVSGRETGDLRHQATTLCTLADLSLHAGQVGTARECRRKQSL